MTRRIQEVSIDMLRRVNTLMFNIFAWNGNLYTSATQIICECYLDMWRLQQQREARERERILNSTFLILHKCK